MSPNQSLIGYNSSASFDKQSLGVLDTNFGSESRTIDFKDPRDLTGYTAKIVDAYYQIDSIYLNYNPNAAGASSYVSPNGTAQFTNVQPSDCFVTLRGIEIATNDVKTFVLSDLSSTYGYTNPTSKSDASKAVRNWEFTKKNGDYATITDADFISKFWNWTTSTLTNRTLDPWTWPIQNLTSTLSVQHDFVTATAPIDSSLFTFSYKNRGEDEQTLIVSTSGLDYSIQGLAYLDLSPNKPSVLYNTQTLTYSTDNQLNVTKQGRPDPDDPNDDAKTYVYCSDEFFLEGYKSQSTLLIDSQGYQYYPTLLISDSDSNLGIKYPYNNNTIRITQPINTSTLPESDRPKIILPMLGSYIFSIRNYLGTDTFTFSAVSDYFDCTWLNADGNSLKNSGTYYYLLTPKTEEAAQLSITFTFVITGSKVNVEISPINLIDEDEGSINFTSELQTKLNQLAQVSGKNAFNYFYVPSDDKIIKNPLSSSSFNNPNHFYNQFTICKVKTYNIANKSNIFINT